MLRLFELILINNFQSGPTKRSRCLDNSSAHIGNRYFEYLSDFGKIHKRDEICVGMSNIMYELIIVFEVYRQSMNDRVPFKAKALFEKLSFTVCAPYMNHWENFL